VDEAFSAGALFLLERTLVEAQFGVSEEFGAFLAEFTVCSMFFLAVALNHLFDGFLFPFHPRMFAAHTSHIPRCSTLTSTLRFT